MHDSFEGLRPVVGFEGINKQEVSSFDIEKLALADPNVLAAFETLKSDPEIGIVHVGGVSEFDNVETTDRIDGNYIAFIKDGNNIKFVAVCSDRGRLVIEKISAALRVKEDLSTEPFN